VQSKCRPWHEQCCVSKGSQKWKGKTDGIKQVSCPNAFVLLHQPARIQENCKHIHTINMWSVCTAKTLYLYIEWYLSSSIPSPAACSRRFRRTETTTTTAMKRRELERERAVSVASYMHARCIPSGRHGHMRTAAGCHGRPWCCRDMQWCKCHHLNRWGSHPSHPWRGEGGQEAWRDRGAAREPALRLQDACGLRGEKGDWLLSSSPTLKTTMAAACYRERHWHRPSSRVTTTPLSLHRERDGQKNLWSSLIFSLLLHFLYH